MKDKIKEILDLLNFNRDTISNRICRVEDIMSREQIIELLDYITNLQEENERLKEENKILNENNQAMQEEMFRTWQKAIEIVKEKKNERN